MPLKFARWTDPSRYMVISRLPTGISTFSICRIFPASRLEIYAPSEYLPEDKIAGSLVFFEDLMGNPRKGPVYASLVENQRFFPLMPWRGTLFS